MAEQLRYAFNDYDGDTQTTSFRVDELASPADYATWKADVDAFATELEKFRMGYSLRAEYVIGVFSNAPASADNVVAQGSTQAILEIQEVSTERIYKERLPMPNLLMADDGSGNKAWISEGQGAGSLTVFNKDHANWALLKAAYDVVGVSPNDLSAELVRIYIEE